MAAGISPNCSNVGLEGISSKVAYSEITRASSSLSTDLSQVMNRNIARDIKTTRRNFKIFFFINLWDLRLIKK